MKLNSVIALLFVAGSATVEAFFFPLNLGALVTTTALGSGLLAAGAGLAALTGLKIGGLLAVSTF